ncbi:rhodanese-like domain-containing protein [Pseudomonas sp. PD9R]|uniref:rhodanese-like domain-containing protein n=1 Tax=Pseudomonas sp. PD9R TaxID=2853534 RepID=UPI001C485DE8|nr:rhodanese-like domain-containing protein [Pseudomonas sp. PD9R]MBV6826522.1 rhodanese-related sulfurtransferase [Pseudomonas sp. PD9R]
MSFLAGNSIVDTPLAVSRIDSAALARLVEAAIALRSEVAIIDVREQKAYSEGLILLSANVPLPRLELNVATQFPRKDVPMVIIDRQGELTAQAAQRLQLLGYTDLAILDGGVEQWERDGLALYSGFNVRSKAFAELIEHEFSTPAISATELFTRRTNGEDIVVLDSRPYDEYHHSTVPDALSVPGAELIRVVLDVIPDPTTTIVVSCGGRTRSIVGAQSLISAGLPNPVFSLRNGTGGLRLDGIDLEYGATRAHPEASPATLAWAQLAARKLSDAVKADELSSAQFSQWLDDTSRTLYVFDLRPGDAFEAGHHPLARHVSGGQLVQAIDMHAPVWGARIILIDDGSLIRARQTAYWLAQLGGFELAIIQQPTLPGALQQGTWQPTIVQPKSAATHTIDASNLARLLTCVDAEARPLVLDLSASPAYRQAHIPGSQWLLRSQLVAHIESLHPGRAVVISAEDGSFARIAVEYLVAENPQWLPRVSALQDGNQGWENAGHALQAAVIEGPEDVKHYIDVWTPPQKTVGDMLDAVKKYLNWEVDLLEQLARDPHRALIIRDLKTPAQLPQA